MANGKCEESEGIAHSLNQHFTLAHLRGYHADTDYSIAKMAVERLSGVILDAEEPGFKHGKIY